MSSPISSGPADAHSEPYTVFSPGQLRLIVGLLGTAMLVSPLTATIYLPLLPLLSAHFHTSAQAINLTITVYIIFQALAPLFLASISDHLGRRPIYLATFTLYTVASLGLALNTSSYAALLVLRALQSLGGSAVLAVSYGTVADVCVPATRGKMLGPVLAASNVGTCVGPIVGGWIASQSGGFRWAFGALAIFGGLMLAALALWMPETARNVVGNGSVTDRRWNRPLWSIVDHCCHTRDAHDDTPANTLPTRSVKMTSPLASIRIIFYPDTALTLWLSASFYAVWYCIQASIPSTYRAAPYAFSELQVGLAYLPGAIGVIVSMYLTGRAMDHNYRHTAARIGVAVDKAGGRDDNDDDDGASANFPIEQARSRGAGAQLVLSLGASVGYGWAVARHAPVAVPLALQFIMGVLATSFVQTFSALLVDAFPTTPSTAATAGTVARCALAAGAVAALQPLCDHIGPGGVFTVLGVVTGGGGLAAVAALRRWGVAWRTARRAQQTRQRQRRRGDDDGRSLEHAPAPTEKAGPG